MSSDWKRFTQGDCPVCSGARKDCRQSLSSKLIYCRHAQAKPSDYIHRGEDKYGFSMWAYKPDAEKWSSEKYQEWQESKKAEKEAEKARHQRSLSDQERDREVRKIFNQLYLSESDRAILKSRKYLSQEFIFNCVSVKQWQPLGEAINPSLPGVSVSGRRLNNPIDGILIPIVNHLGYWVGMRLYNPRAAENNRGKYTYLSSAKRGITPHNQKGEHYLSVYIPDDAAPVIGLCEGLEFKPAIASKRLGIPIIGASGGNFASSPETLKEAIAHIEGKLGKCELILFPDGGSRVNRSVHSQYEKLDQLVELDLIADWGQWDDKAGGDIDEIDNLAQIEYRSPEEFFPPDEQRNILQEQFGKILSLFGKGKKKFKPKRKVKSITYDRSKGLPSFDEWVKMGEPLINYEPEDRLDCWLELRRKGYRHALDSSFMGSGKSHAVPLYAAAIDREMDRVLTEASRGNRPEEGIKKSIVGYISTNYADPPVEALKQFVPLLPRGEETGCDRAHLFTKMADLGYDPNIKNHVQKDDKGFKNTNIICKTCPKFNFCGNEAGMYRFERWQTLENALNIRMHPSSLVRGGDSYPYERTDIFIEEAGKELKPIRTIKTSEKDLILELDRCMEKFPERFDIFNELIYLVNFHYIKLLLDIPKYLPKYFISEIIHDYLEAINYLAILHEALMAVKLEDFVFLNRAIKNIFRDKRKHGLNRNQIRGLLPKFESLELMLRFVDFSSFKLEEAFESPDRILIKDQDIKDIADKEKFKQQIGAANRIINHETKQKTEENIAQLPARGLIHILKVLRGDKNVTARANKGKIFISIEDRWYKQILERARITFFLDATLSKERLKLITGIDGPIVEVRAIAEAPLKNLTIYNVQIPGTKSAQMSDRAIGATGKVIEKIQEVEGGEIPVLTHKKLAERFDTDSWWGNHNRGTNKFEAQKTLIGVGTPHPNLGLVRDEYFILKGNLIGFEDYYEQLIRAEQIQFIGRQRCQRYQEEQFKLYLLGAGQDFSWLRDYGCRIIDEHGSQYASEAGGKLHHLKHQIWLIAHQMAKETGGKVTQAELAARVGKSQGRISQVVREAGLTMTKFWRIILENINSANKPLCSGTNNFKDDPDYRDWMGLSAVDCLRQTIEAIEDLGWVDFKKYLLDNLPELVRIKILGVLAPLFIEVPYLQTE